VCSNKRRLNPGFQVQSSIYLRSAPNCVDHFVSRLHVFKLRPKQQCLSVEFLSDSGIGLRWERLTSFELSCSNPARFVPIC
jgi:hypothetical protein